MATIWTEVELDVDIEDHLHEVDTDILVEELQNRGRNEVANPMLIYVLTQLWEAKRYGTPEKFDEVFHNLCGEHLGKAT